MVTGISMQRGHWVGFCGVLAGAGRLDSGAGGARQRAGIESCGRIERRGVDECGTGVAREIKAENDPPKVPDIPFMDSNFVLLHKQVTKPSQD